MKRKERRWLLLASGAILGIVLVMMEKLVLADVAPTTTISKHNLTFVKAIFLGMVQGLTEFLPISSTAHLKVVPVALGWGDPGVTITAVIQLGSIAAVVWYFWHDLTKIITGMVKAIRNEDYKSQDFRLGLGIGLGTLPIVICGLLLKVFVPDLDNSAFRSTTTIALASIVMALLLGWAEYQGKRVRSFNRLDSYDGVLIGVAQSLALIPGVSRSGSTITAGLFIGLQRETAARFSFLLGIPAITLAGLVELVGVVKTGVQTDELLILLVGTVSSAFWSYLTIAWLIRYLQKQSTWVFVWYRLVFGIVLLGAISLGKISN